MTVSLKPAVVAVLTYLRENPGAVAFVAGEGVILLAKVGVNVTSAQLSVILAVLIPVLLGYFHTAKKAQARARGKALAATLAAAHPVVVPSEPVAERPSGTTQE